MSVITTKEHTKRLCLIPLCKNERFDLVHKFPMDNQRAEEWRRAINIPEINSLSLDLLRKRTICSKHFRKEDYKNVESRSLNKTAVPSLNFREPEGAQKANSDVTLKCHDQSFCGVINTDSDKLMECEMVVQNNAMSSKIVVENSDHQHRNLLKYACNASTAFNDDGSSSKYRFVDAEISCSDLDFAPVSKTIDGKYKVSLVQTVSDELNLDNLINLDQPTEAVNYIQNSSSHTNGIIQQLKPSYVSKCYSISQGSI